MVINIIENKAPDALVIPLFQQKNLADQLAEIAQRSGIDPGALKTDFRAEAREVFVLYGLGPVKHKYYLVGLGKNGGFQSVYLALRAFCFRYKQKLPKRVGVDLRYFNSEELPQMTDAAVNGMLLGLYQPGVFRTDPKPDPAPTFGQAKSRLDILVAPGMTKIAVPAARRGNVIAGVTRQIFDLVNAPGNRNHPQTMVEWALQAGRESGVQVRILDNKSLQKKGLEALVAVGKGSPHPPALVLLEYNPKPGKTKLPVIGLVGKGVTFDTGGVSLKPSANMHFMKSDMGGAAAVFGAFMVAAGLNLPVRLVGAIPVAENMIDGLALKPGDVIGSYSGKTIEVTDTDAEGRLILADGLAYLNRQEKPDVLIDIATLTGSVIRTLGYFAAGLFTPNDNLANTLIAAGETCGERLWRLPLWDEYATDLKSDVADLRNFTGKPMAEAISAAKFIEHFTAGHPAWAHIDVAGTAFGETEFGQSKTATGFGIRLLVEFIEKWVAK